MTKNSFVEEVTFKQNFNFILIRKTEAIPLCYLRLTKHCKNLQNNHFLPFLTQNGQKFVPNFLQIWYF